MDREDHLKDSEQTGLSLEQILATLRRRAPWIALCFILVTGTAFSLSEVQSKRYTATAALVFNNNQLSQQAAGLQPVGVNNQQAQQNTNLKLVQLGDMAEKTALQLGHGLTKAKVNDSLKVSAQGESDIVNVSATAATPALARAITNTYSQQFVADQQNSNHQYYASALALVNKQLAALSPRQRLSAAGIALQNRAQSLGVLAELRSGNVQIAQTASLPRAPSSPKTHRNTILGAIFGLSLGLGVALLIERLDRRISEPKDLQEIYELPLLGVVPESRALSRSVREKGASNSLSAAEADAFHLIRAHMRYFNVDRQLRTVLVASAAPGDGKTTVARHLAAAAASSGSRVLLMELDLRRPTIARQLALRATPGISDVLIGAAEVETALQSVDVSHLFPNRLSGRALHVLVAGAVLPPNPGAMIESRAMEAVLERVKSAYDLVVIDTPPLTAVSDALPLLCKVDGVIIVGWVGRNRRDVAQRLHETLTTAGAPLLGVIANGFKPGRLDGYGYGYGYKPDKRASADDLAYTVPPRDPFCSDSPFSWADESPAEEAVAFGDAEDAGGLWSHGLDVTRDDRGPAQSTGERIDLSHRPTSSNGASASEGSTDKSATANGDSRKRSAESKRAASPKRTGSSKGGRSPSKTKS
jgi:succinoglycan biosynthesis transport protein ExoP